MIICTTCNEDERFCNCSVAFFHGNKLQSLLNKNSINIEDFCFFLNKRKNTTVFLHYKNMAHLIFIMLTNGVNETPNNIVEIYLQEQLLV